MRIQYLCGAALLLFSVEASAGDYVGEFGGWDVSKFEDGCIALMEYEGPGSTQVAIKKFASSGVGLLVNNYNWSAKPDETYEVTFALNGTNYSGDVVGSRVSARSGFVATFSDKFEGDFVKGSSLYIYLGDQQIDQLSLDGTAVAMQAVNRCLATVRAELAAAERERARYAHLPTDPFAPPPLPPGDPKPRDINIWAGRIQMDYPSSALRTEASGRVRFTTTVAANGRVSDCRVTESSGHADLDEAACRGMRLYARFDPAIDDDGNPIEGEWSSAVRYTLPE